MPYREIAQDWPIRKIPGPRGGAWEMCLATDGSKHQDGSLLDARDSEELFMQSISTIGLDIAKSVFQVHGVDAAGQAVS